MFTSAFSVVGASRIVSQSAVIAGSGRGVCHVTFRALAAWMACSSRSATTPTKFPWGTTFTTPGIPATSQVPRMTRAQYDTVVKDLLGLGGDGALALFAPSTARTNQVCAPAPRGAGV